jgi:hypothetical protein
LRRRSLFSASKPATSEKWAIKRPQIDLKENPPRPKMFVCAKQIASTWNRLMKTLTIKHRLMAQVALSAAITLVVAALAWSNSRLAARSTEQLVVTTAAVKDSMMSDMMHDAIRADVYAAQLAGLAQDDKALEAATKDFEEHIGVMKKSLHQVLKSPLPGQTLREVQEALPVVDQYAAQAVLAFNAIKANPHEAGSVVDSFTLVFGDAEAALGKSGDAIEKAAEKFNPTPRPSWYAPNSSPWP